MKKKTHFGLIPNDWEVVRLGEILLLLRNGLTKIQNKEKTGYPITRIETISAEKVNPEKVGFVENITKEEIENYKVIKGDILFSHINSLKHIGKTAIYEGVPDTLLHGMNLLILRPDTTKTITNYLFYRLKYMRVKGIFKNISKKAVNQASINQTELSKVKLPLPPLHEQKEIAQILGTVNEAIEKVDRAIGKTKRLKKGLMQELLTKGIGHKEFKDTKIGRIPKEWEVVGLGEIGNIITGKTPSTFNKEYWNGNMPFITPGDIKNSKYVYTTEKYVSPKGANQVGGVLPKDAILTVCIGSTIGKTALTHTNSITNQQINALICKNSVDSHYIYYSVSLKTSLLKSYSGISAVPIIKKSLFEKINLPLPSVTEQKKIAKILSSVDKRLELLRERKKKFEKVKRGLMNDLLTGKRRVRM